MDVSQLVSLLAQGSPVAVLVGIIVALWRGELVPRYVYERERERADKLRDQIPQNTRAMNDLIALVLRNGRDGGPAA